MNYIDIGEDEVRYEIASSVIILNKYVGGTTWYAKPTLMASNDSVDADIKEIAIGFETPFNTNAESFSKLGEKEFNLTRPNAGIFNMAEYELIRESHIKITPMSRNEDGTWKARATWRGIADLHWDDKFGENVPFYAEFDTLLRVVWGGKKVKA